MYITAIPVHKLVKPEFRMKITQTFSSPNFRHRAVMSIFPQLPGNPRADANILFRLETLPGLAPRFIIQSDVSPLEENLPDGISPKKFSLPQLPIGSPVSIRLAINPIIRHTDGSVSTVPPFGKIAADEKYSLDHWLASKLIPALGEVQILNSNRETLIETDLNKNTSKRKKIVIDLVDAVARVTDTQTLTTMLHKGVGRAKAYGCGLLSVKQI